MTKTRFAPSPTGVLHVGGARTALFCWLFSRKTAGKFVLRIEDTDLERSTPESVQAILDGMAWLGLDPDEGPYFQTKRFDRYLEVIGQLIDQGDAYYCECSRERLDALREKQMADRQKPRYDGCCRELGLRVEPGKAMVVRFRNPQHGVVSFHDHVKGVVSVANQELDDLIIARSDGSPTYNLSVVVDDMDMEITHVLRGDDHVNNTPRQINILRALQAKIPEYAHVPMILGDDGKRLSKRHGAVGVMEYFEAGYLPEAMLNYLVRLGWSHGDQEIFSRQEMIEYFSLDALNNSAASFNTDKLNWINQQYMMSMPLDDIVALVRHRLDRLAIDYDHELDIAAIVDLYRQRAVTINALVDSIGYCFRDFDSYDAKAAGKVLRQPALQPLQRALELFTSLQSWDAQSLHAVIETITGELGIGMGKIGQPLRVAVTGGSFSPPIDQTLELLGRERSLARIQRAIDYISATMTT
ncbi:MAG: glutamate--tRNA ligase [Gammaproteobacteria bacterium]|nr:glutamate--tRNA ligase [Gammaproteobacteria bacterium]MDH3534945.1 glutamate--tRNA ligase [Gammaproteobacteria bacterium]